MGDHTTEEGRKFLASRSPLTHVDRIVRPLLIGQGGNDVRVTVGASRIRSWRRCSAATSR